MVLNYIITKPVDQVYQCLTDMQKFAEVHPVIYKVEQLSKTEFLFYEKIKIVFIPFSFNYKVNLKISLMTKPVEVDSQVQKGVYLTLKFLLQEKNNQTEVQEEINIKANVFIKIIFKVILKNAHKKLFQNIDKAKQ